jgi:hypothetical protein
MVPSDEMSAKLSVPVGVEPVTHAKKIRIRSPVVEPDGNVTVELVAAVVTAPSTDVTTDGNATYVPQSYALTLA